MPLTCLLFGVTMFVIGGGIGTLFLAYMMGADDGE